MYGAVPYGAVPIQLYGAVPYDGAVPIQFADSFEWFGCSWNCERCFLKQVMTLETWLRLWSLARKMTALANSFSSALITAFDSQSGKKRSLCDMLI